MRAAVVAAILCSAVFALRAATTYYVAPGGNGGNPGTIVKPLGTVQSAIDKAKPGDVIYLRGGVYREAIKLRGRSGSEGAPITLSAYPGETPVISGLDLPVLQWEKTARRGIYSASFEGGPFQQAFFNGAPMLEARWPNVPRDSKGNWDFFSPAAWSTVNSSGNQYGTIKDAHLAATGMDVTGAWAVLNVTHQFFSWTRRVQRHAPGSDTLVYPKDLGPSVDGKDEAKMNLQSNDDRYYLFGQMQFLDAPGEWFLDQEHHKIYFYAPDGRSPAAGKFEIKTRDWALVADEQSSYLTLDGLTFFGTAFRFGKDLNNRSSHIILRNSQVLYSSWTEYVRMPAGGPHQGDDGIYPTIEADHARIVNNTFAWGALTALYINGWDNLIENNAIHDFDYSSSLTYPPLQVSKAQPSHIGKAGRATVRYNSIYRSGGIQVQVAQRDNNVYLNDIYDSFLACWGGNKDVSALYTQRPFCTGTRLHHNWVHGGYAGTPPHPWGGGMGIRGDDDTCGLTVDHNVVWNVGSVGINIKNVSNPTPEQANVCANNTVFAHSKYNPIQGAIIIEFEGSRQGPIGPTGNGNSLSTVVNNLAAPICGSWFCKPIGAIKQYSNNSTAFDAASQLVNVDRFDFRPLPRSSIVQAGVSLPNVPSDAAAGKAPDIGAYEAGASEYWIPGRRDRTASRPIVPDRADRVAVDTDLIWLQGYESVASDVYFGRSKRSVEGANRKSPEYNGLQKGNIFRPSHLSGGSEYYWRIDAVGAAGQTAKGPVWTFRTE